MHIICESRIIITHENMHCSRTVSSLPVSDITTICEVITIILSLMVNDDMV